VPPEHVQHPPLNQQQHQVDSAFYPSWHGKMSISFQVK